MRFGAGVALALSCALAAPPCRALALIDAAEALSRRHDVGVVLDAAIDPRIDVDAGLLEHARLEAALDAIASRYGLAWHRDPSGAVVLAPDRVRAVARIALDPLLVVAPPADIVDRALSEQRRGTGALAPPQPAVLDAADLAHEPDGRIERLGRRAPNVTGSGAQFAIRGIARDDGLAATSSVTLDGLPVSPLVLDAAALDLFDLEEIRYERGPASSRVGPFSLAGLVQLRSRKPEPDAHASVHLEHDEHAARRAAASGGGALDREGAWMLQGSARARREDEGIAFAIGDRLVGAERDDLGATARLRYAPPSGRLGVELVAHGLRQRGASFDIRVPDAPAPGFDPYAGRSSRASVPRRELDSNLVGATLAYGFDDARVWITAGGSDSRLAQSQRDGPFDRGESVHEDDWRRAALWYSGALGPALSLTAGLEHTRRELVAGTLDATDLRAYFPTSVAIEPVAERRLGVRADSRLDVSSAVLELAWRGRHATFSGGLRRVREDRSERTRTFADLAPSDCEIVAARTREACSAQFPMRDIHVAAATGGSVWLPSASLFGDAGESWRWAVHYRTGYRSGGARYDRLQARSAAYAEEHARAYEASVEWRPADGPVRARAALFAHRWTDQQVPLALPEIGGLEIANAGRARSHGGELEIEAKLGERFALTAGLGLLRTRYDALDLPAPGGTVDASGNRFPDAPQGTVALGARWHSPSGWYVAAQGWYAGDAYSDAANRESARRPSYQVVDLRTGFRAARFEGYVGVSNVFDEAWLEAVELRGLSGTPRGYRVGPPRTFTLGVVFDF